MTVKHALPGLGMSYSCPNGELPFPPPVADIKTILVVKHDAIGDFVMCTAFFKSLRELYPQAKILLSVRYLGAEFAQLCPYIDDKVIAPENILWPLDNARKFGEIIAAEHPFAPFDLVIAPKFDYDWESASYVVAGTKAKYRLGYAVDCTFYKQEKSRPGMDENYTVILHDTTIRHEVEYKHRMLNALGLATTTPPPLEIWITDTDEQAVLERGLMPVNLIPKLYFTLGIGTTKTFKTWDHEKYTALVKKLLDANPLLKVVILGAGEYDENIASQMVGIFGADRCVSFVDRCELRHTYLIIKNSLFFLGNDSFCGHATAAAQTPALILSCYPTDAHHINSLYHPTRMRPWASPHVLVHPDSCGPAEAITAQIIYGPKCVNNISLEAGVAGLQKLIAQENLDVVL